MTSGERLLLISPAFHGYYRSIAQGFSNVGYEVVTHCYDDYSTLSMKVRNKLSLELPEKLGGDRSEARQRWDTSRAVEAFRAANPDRILVLKGDSLGEDFWTEVTDRGIPRILWLYDDLSRHDYSIEFLEQIGPVISYAASEAQQLQDSGVDAHYLPNGFDPDLVVRPSKRNADIVFVGSRYPNRVDLLERLAQEGIPVRAYGRQWSRHPFDRLRTWEISRPDVPASRDIPLQQAYSVQAAAAAAINIHGLQEGLAMRTFEVPGMGGLQLVDREDVAEFYEPGEEVLVFSGEDDLLEICRRVAAEPEWGEKIRQAGRKRSLAEHTFTHRATSVEEWWA